MSESPTLKRPRFFDGKLITPADLELEQQYFREKFKRHNRSLHGFGIASGLKVTARSGQIVVEPGLALDCEGNELLVEAMQSIVPPPIGDARITYLSIRLVERCTDLLSTAGGEEASTITESVEFAFGPENSNRGHRHLRARWLACGQPHALTIAKLRPGANAWRVDRGYRAPAIK
jgi:hypothetical protein